jgi:pyruvate formate lyase activating enzyme
MHDALKLAGKVMTAKEVMEVVNKDRLYYDNSGGGLTISGGEPLLYPEYCAELFSLAQAGGIHTALDTAADVPYEAFSAALPHTDAVLLDLKIMESTLHEAYTGHPNYRILENARRLFSEPVDLYVRIPIIAGVNDTKRNITERVHFLQDAANLKEIRLLPYHGLGTEKAQSIGLSQESFETPEEHTLEQLAACFAGLVVW